MANIEQQKQTKINYNTKYKTAATNKTNYDAKYRTAATTKSQL